MARLVYVVVEDFCGNFSGLEAFSTKKKAFAYLDKRIAEVLQGVKEDDIVENTDIVTVGYQRILAHRLVHKTHGFVASNNRYYWAVYEKEI